MSSDLAGSTTAACVVGLHPRFVLLLTRTVHCEMHLVAASLVTSQEMICVAVMIKAEACHRCLFVELFTDYDVCWCRHAQCSLQNEKVAPELYCTAHFALTTNTTPAGRFELKMSAHHRACGLSALLTVWPAAVCNFCFMATGVVKVLKFFSFVRRYFGMQLCHVSGNS